MQLSLDRASDLITVWYVVTNYYIQILSSASNVSFGIKTITLTHIDLTSTEEADKLLQI